MFIIFWNYFQGLQAQILTSTTIDFKRKKNPWEQPIFFPIQNLSGNSWQKMLVVTGKKRWLVPSVFFLCLKSMVIDVSVWPTVLLRT